MWKSYAWAGYAARHLLPKSTHNKYSGGNQNTSKHTINHTNDIALCILELFLLVAYIQNHYKQFKIEPFDFIHQNDLGFAEGNVVKYICRWRDKGGVEDLRKAIRYIELIIEGEENETDS